MSARPFLRMTRLLHRERCPYLHQRTLTTDTSEPSPSSSSLPPPSLPNQSTPLRSPYRILHDRPFQHINRIKTYPPPPSYVNTHKNPLQSYSDTQITLLDPSGQRTRLFSPDNNDGARIGDMLHCTFQSGEPFNGIILALRRRGIDTSILLRNKLEQTGVELWLKIYSPLLKSVEVVQRAQDWMRRGKRARRAKLYFMGRSFEERNTRGGRVKKGRRGKMHQMPNVEGAVREYLKKRRQLLGKGLGEGDISLVGLGGGRKKKR